MPLTKIQGNALASSLVTTSSITTSNTITNSGTVINSGVVTNSGNTNFTGNASFQNFTFYQEGTFEKANVIASTSGANIVVNLADSAGIVYYTDNATANATVNFTGMSGVQTGNVASSVVILTNNTNPKYISTIQVEGTATGVTARWAGGAPTSGSANIDVYSFSIVKTGASTYTVLGQLSNFQ